MANKPDEQSNLYDKVRYPTVYDCWKHELHPDPEEFATQKINEMTPNELLQAISDALEEAGIRFPA